MNPAQKDSSARTIPQQLQNAAPVCQARFMSCLWFGLFRERDHQDGTGIPAEITNQSTGPRTIGHIIVSGKSDYYDIHDD